MYRPETFLKVKSEEKAKKMAEELISRSIFFTCEPLPNGPFEFGVKREVSHIAEEIRDRS